jgi:hypothetical protein
MTTAPQNTTKRTASGRATPGNRNRDYEETVKHRLCV